MKTRGHEIFSQKNNKSKSNLFAFSVINNCCNNERDNNFLFSIYIQVKKIMLSASPA